jgi:hypothetical protein
LSKCLFLIFRDFFRFFVLFFCQVSFSHISKKKNYDSSMQFRLPSPFYMSDSPFLFLPFPLSLPHLFLFFSPLQVTAMLPKCLSLIYQVFFFFSHFPFLPFPLSSPPPSFHFPFFFLSPVYCDVTKTSKTSWSTNKTWNESGPNGI